MNISTGAGSDTITLMYAPTSGFTLDAGSGFDTLDANGWSTSQLAPYFSAIRGVERVVFGTARTADLSSLSAVQEVSLYSPMITAVVSGIASGTVLEFRHEGFAPPPAPPFPTTFTPPPFTAQVAGAAAGALDALTLRLNHQSFGTPLTANFYEVAVPDVERLTVESTADQPTLVKNRITLTDSALTSLVIKGSSDLEITNAQATLRTVDASAFTGKLVLSLAGNSEGVSYIGGSGADVVTGGSGADTLRAGHGQNVVTGGGGADVMTGGSGVDTWRYAAASDSTLAQRDTITNFDPSADRIDLSPLAFAGAAFRGNGSGTAAVEALFTGVAGDAAFDSSGAVLYIDVDGSRTIGAGDMAIQLTGVGSLTAANLVFS
jgi:Ca2+-binding RTX toxin-like protein